MAELNHLLLQVGNVLWSYIVVTLCLVGGVYCSARLALIQFRGMPHAVALLRGKYENIDDADGITTLQALSTALSGTTGIGNIAGVAIAIKTGGPGAIFWMWMMALLGMALKYTEATLGSLYRGEIGGRHVMGGGPMYYIMRGLGDRWRPMAVFYCVCTAIACLGGWNMFQSNQAAATLEAYFDVPTWVTGMVLSVAAALVLIGGIQRIGKVASRLVPSMCLIYVSVVMVICLLNMDKLPHVMNVILSDAFRFDSASGGVLGTTILIGIRRAIFSNESATGSAAIAHAAAHTAQPVRQGVVASLGPFIDTIVVCAFTAFAILLSGYYGTESYQNRSGEVVSFEHMDGNQSPGWRLVRDEIPADDHPLQKFTHGDAVLRYSSQTATPQAVSPTIELASLADGAAHALVDFDAIRFSAHVGIEALSVRMVNMDGEVIIELPVSLKESEVSSDSFCASITGVHSLQRWNSWLITPDARLKALIMAEGERSGISLQFAASGIGEAHVDRVEMVNSASGIVLSAAAFERLFGVFGSIFIPIAALLFAYTTIIAGNYYGEVACHFLNEKLVTPYLWLYITAIFLGSTANLDVVINFSDLTLGLMTLPNTLALILLTPVVVRETEKYFSALRSGEFDSK